MASKKKNVGPAARERGIVIGATARKMKDGDVAEGIVTTVEQVTGGTYDNERTRLTLVTEDGEVNIIYMPDRWASSFAQWGGSYTWVTRNGMGLATRWKVEMEKGAKPLATPLVIGKVTMEAREKGKRGDKARASKNAKKALR